MSSTPDDASGAAGDSSKPQKRERSAESDDTVKRPRQGPSSDSDDGDDGDLFGDKAAADSSSDDEAESSSRGANRRGGRDEEEEQQEYDEDDYDGDDDGFIEHDIDDYKDRYDAPPPSARKRKKGKKRSGVLASLIEDEAESGTDSDEQDEDDTGGGVSQEFLDEAARQDEARRLRTERGTFLDRNSDHASMEAIVGNVEMRARRQREQQAAIRAMTATQKATGRRPPNATDPSLFTMRVKPGKETDIVMRITNKMVFNMQKGIPNHIISVFYRGTKGHICIETTRSDYVKDAVQGLEFVYPWTVYELRLEDMIPIVRPARTKQVLRPGDWVRYRKRGTIYRKDLAEIVDVSRGGNVLIVKMVPRVDYTQKLLRSDSAPDEALKQRSTIRPPQKLFRQQEAVVQHGQDAVHETNGMHVNKYFETPDVYFPKLPDGEDMPLRLFNGQHYTPDGFLLVEAPLRDVITKDVRPDHQETVQFREGTSDLDLADGATGADRIQMQIDRLRKQVDDNKRDLVGEDSALREHFNIGDRVVVVQGELKRLSGTIESIESSALGSADTQISVRPSTKEFGSTVWQFAPSELRKQYKVGDHVKIRAGPSAGETGTIIKVYAEDVENQIAVIISDLSKDEHVAPCRHMQMTKEIAQGLRSLQGYHQYDLVRIGRNEVGVIIEVGREHLRLVLQDGSTKKIAPSEIQASLNMHSKRATQMTHSRDTIAVDDTVRVISGDYKGTVAVIKHIHKAFLFLYSQSTSVNGGIVVVKARQVEINGTRSADPVQLLLQKGYQVPGFPRSRFHIMKLKEHNKRSDAQLAESLLGKKVRIIAGNHKGRIGHVSNMRQDMCFVGLSALGKKISIHKDSLQKVDTAALRRQSSLHATATTYGGAATAAAAEQTGVHNGSGLMTGDRTPMALDSGGSEDEGGNDDPWDPDAEGYDENVSWAFQGVVTTMDGFGEGQWILCENATEKYDDERVLVRTTQTGETRMVELSKLHYVNPTGTGPVIVISGDRAGQLGEIKQFNPASAVQTVSVNGGDITLPLDDVATYDWNNAPTRR